MMFDPAPIVTTLREHFATVLGVGELLEGGEPLRGHRERIDGLGSPPLGHERGELRLRRFEGNPGPLLTVLLGGGVECFDEPLERHRGPYRQPVRLSHHRARVAHRAQVVERAPEQLRRFDGARA